jgi:hypothetical protein
MIERNISDCKYVNIFNHRVGSIGAPSKRTMFIRGTNTKQFEVPKIAGRNMKLTFSKGESRIQGHDRPEQKKCIKVVSPFT